MSTISVISDPVGSVNLHLDPISGRQVIHNHIPDSLRKYHLTYGCHLTCACNRIWYTLYTPRFSMETTLTKLCAVEPGIVLCMSSANERGRYNVTSSLIGWAHIQNDPWVPGVKCLQDVKWSSIITRSISSKHMMTSWYRNILSITSLDVFFVVSLNKLLNTQSRGNYTHVTVPVMIDIP